MKKIRIVLTSILLWFLGIFACTVVCVIALISWLLDPFKGRGLNFFHKVWGYSIALVGCSSIRVSGRENVPEEGALVFFANHSSLFDIFILSGVTPGHCAYFSKQEVFFVPLVGLLMWLQGCVPVNRKKPREALLAIDKAIENLRKGLRMIVYPEGTRSPDGKILPFKSGSLRMASTAQVPVIPVTIHGSSHIMRKGSLLLHRHPVNVVFGTPMTPPHIDASNHDKQEFLENARQRIIQQFDDCESGQRSSSTSR